MHTKIDRESVSENERCPQIERERGGERERLAFTGIYPSIV